GYLIGAILTISIGYASLILGFSIEGSELAAILGFAVLRGGLKRRSIVENNINQTIASAVNSASAGMMFSVPALFILGYDKHFNPLLLTLGCMAGGVLGVAFIIPLRKQMIDFDRLSYPGGVAVATILKSPGAGMKKARWLILGGIIAAIVKLVVISLPEGEHYSHEMYNAGAALGLPSYLNLTWYVSAMTIGIGFIAGRGGVYFIVGGYLCYFVLAPILAATGAVPLETAADSLRVERFRPLGIGMLIGGALAGIVIALPLLVGAIRSMHNAAKSGQGISKDELPIKLLYFAIAAACGLLITIAISSTQGISATSGETLGVLGTLWIWIAGVILSECIGRTNWSPLSGMTLIGVTILIFVVSSQTGLSEKESVVAALTVGAAMCVAMSQATDLMLDLKTGYLVGAMPRKQQIGQLLGTWLGPILVIGLIYVLHNGYADQGGLGSDKLPAAQAKALAGVIESLLQDNVPTEKYVAGASIGAILSWSGIGGLGVLVGLGFYLPFGIALTYSIGTALRLITEKSYGSGFVERVGIPLSAGLIVGEALVGVGHAIVVVIGKSAG
ncbi:MAG: oligopeptide transporter, OPT family, partial [Planctomycetota bacterium]